MYSIEKRLRLLSDVSDLMLMGSIHVYGAKKSRVKIALHKQKKQVTEQRIAA